MKELTKRLEDISSKIDLVQNEINETSRLAKLEFTNPNKSKICEDVLRLTKLFSDSDHLMRLVWDDKFRIIYANKTFLRVMKYKLEDIIGRPLFNEDGSSDFMTPDTVERSKLVVSKNLENGVKMISGAENKWIDSEGEEVKMDWLLGFNDKKTNIGSSQCLLLSS